MSDTYKVNASDSTYLDPANCDSVASYKIVTFYNEKYTRLEAYVDLSDCNRKISWSFGDDDDAVDKIDKAISMLSSFRKELVKAQKEVKAKKAEIKPKNG